MVTILTIPKAVTGWSDLVVLPRRESWIWTICAVCTYRRKMLRCGIVGLPNAGKSTLFNALVALHRGVGGKASLARTGPYPFTTVDPNVGIVVIPDPRLDELARVLGSQRVTPVTIELVDIAGLVKGAHRGEGLGNEFLSHIRAVDAILHVVRVFEDAEVVRAGSRSPREDITAIRAELEAKDAEIRERRKQAKNATASVSTDTDLAAKPVLIVFNVGEHTQDPPPEAAEFQPSVVISAKIEAELTEMADVERAVFLREYGLDHARTADVVRALLDLLGLVTFFTANKNEARAWLLPHAATALQAAEKIHTDFARGFIRAEVVPLRELVAAGSMTRARELGRVREEGKTYVVQDGDVLVIKANP